MNKIIKISLIIIVIFGTLYYLKCTLLPKIITKQLENKNYCTQDTDCKIERGLGCPFACFTLINKNENINILEKAALYYKTYCPDCMYKCQIHPTQEEVKCINSKCIDSRTQDRTGNESDKYGCNMATGFSYDPEIKVCLHAWKINESQKNAAVIAAKYLREKNIINEKGANLIDVIEFKCPGCYKVRVSQPDINAQIIVTNLQDNSVTSINYE